MNRIGILFQKLFVKKRFIYSASKEQQIEQVSLAEEYYLVCFNTLSDIEEKSDRTSIETFLKGHYSGKGANRRLNDKNWIGFAVLNKIEKEVAGISWLIYPKNAYWYDNVKFSSKEIQIVNLQVSSKYRGKRIGKFLYHHCYREGLKSANFSNILAIVESYRNVAVHNQGKVSQVVAENYLLKIFGINMFSVYKGQTFKVWYVGPFSNRKLKYL